MMDNTVEGRFFLAFSKEPLDQVPPTLSNHSISSQQMMFHLPDLVFVRHGERQDFVEEWVPPSPERAYDPPLSEHGIQQAAMMSAFVRDTPRSGVPTVGFILCSPFVRCVRTALEVARPLGLKIKIEEGLCEWPALEVPSVELLDKEFPGALDLSYTTLVRVPTTPETVQQLHDRCAHLVAEILRHYNVLCPKGTPAASVSSKHGFSSRLCGCGCEGKSVMFVGHAATVIAAVRAAVHQVCPVHCGVCSVSHVLFGKSNSWVLEKNGCSDFLPGGEQRHWDFNDCEEGDLV
ncbi:phosphoglycerate mutase family protein [Pelomyxa schiedti]|nr:phosphoglycerate mutase family protein [Pelomyxa schiedti]